jgi:hypothetical protein
LRHLGSGRFDFVDMTLVQNAANSAIAYYGKGYIRQTDDDVLTFKLYAAQTQNNDFAAYSNRLLKIKPGTVIDEEDYYTLTCRGVDGSVCTAEHVLPFCNWFMSGDNPIVSGTIRRCVLGAPRPETQSLQMHYFEKADLPCPFNEYKFSIDIYEFTVRKSDTGFSVCAKSQSPLPSDFYVRVDEALRFMLAKSVECRVIVFNDCVELLSHERISPRTALQPPIARGSPSFLTHSWHVFERYLMYVVRETPYPYWNPCTGYLHNACEASANSLDAWGIGLAVAIEGLANLLPFEMEPEKKARLTSLKKSIIEHVAENSALSEFTERIKNLVGDLTRIRAVDRLYELARIQKTDSTLVKTWKRLRNPAVHPTKRAIDDVVALDLQSLIDDINCVTVLMYHIVFALISYAGPYTNYAVQGFPIANYPLDSVAPSSTTSGENAATGPLSN